MKQDFADQVFSWYFKLLDLGIFEFANMARGNTAAGFNNNRLTSLDIKCCGFTPQAFRYQFHFDLGLAEGDLVRFEKRFKNVAGFVSECTQYDGRRQFTTTVNTRKDAVFWIKFEIEPGPTIRDDTSAEQKFA